MVIGLLSILGFGLLATAVVLLLIALILLFEVFMFVHVIQNDNIPNDRKLLWLIGMILIHPFVAIAYLFTDYRASKPPVI